MYPLGVINSSIFGNNDFNVTNHDVDHLNEPILPQPECGYIFCTHELRHNFPNDSLKVFSYNIRSIPQHLDFFFRTVFKSSWCSN